MRKVFFSDLDGTLLTTNKKISPAIRSAIDLWLANDNLFVLSSGRPLISIKEVINDFKLFHENVYAIAFNGAQIYKQSTDEILFSRTLDVSLAKQILKLAMDNNIYAHTYDDTHIIAPSRSDNLMFYTKTIHLPYKIPADFPASITVNPCKVLCIDIHAPERLLQFAELLQKTFPGKLCTLKSNPFLLEVFPNDSGKGQAVKDFCTLMNIPIKNSFAAGDESNDLSMLMAAGTSIAMLNGKDELKKNATYITEKTNDEDGLLPFLIS